MSRQIFKEKQQATKGGDSSFRWSYYGGASGTVPFTWESRPGTPKHPMFSETSLPPLTPPPSYQFKNSAMHSKSNKHSKPRFLRTMFPGIIIGSKNSSLVHVSPSFSSSSSAGSSFSSYSLPSTPLNYNIKTVNKRVRFPRSRSAAQFEVEDYEDEKSADSPTSIFCFGVRKASYNSSTGKRQTRLAMNVKQTLSSLIGIRGN